MTEDDLCFTNEVKIRRRPSDVFAFVSDFTQLPRWNYAIRTTRKSTPGQVSVGSVFHQVRTIPAVAEETFEVTEWEPEHLVGITGDFGPFTGALTYRVTPTAKGAMLTNDVKLEVPPCRPMRLRDYVFGARLQPAMAENLEALRRGLERGF